MGRAVTDRFPGYVIASSRRLGMEGLRQRHCVASYHRQLVKGSSAIASVFIDKTRWTVQLYKTKNAKHPLRIGQIRSKLNRMPTPTIEKAIHEVLDIEEFVYTPTRRHETTQAVRSYKENLRMILPALQELGLTEVEVYFDGSGDSGCIEDVTFLPSEVDTNNVTVEIVRLVNKLVDDEFVRREERHRVSLLDAIENITYDYLEESGTNWVDNEGGFGYLKLDVAAATVSLSVDYRYMESRTEYENTLDIISGEPTG